METTKVNGFLKVTPENGDFNQYWYSPKTLEAIVGEVVAHGKVVACVSTPSVYFSLPKELQKTSYVLDVDKQWAKTPGFVYYDFNDDSTIPPSIHNTCDYVVVDPPFITRDVWEKYAVAIKKLLAPEGKILITTTAENSEMILELVGASPVPFQPSIPHLVYQYCLFTNYTPTSQVLLEWNPEIPRDD